MLRETIRRFIAERVLPFADAWEERRLSSRATCCVTMGELGLFGIRYPGRVRRFRPRHALDSSAGRRAWPQHLRRLRRHGTGAYRHGLAAHLSRRHCKAQKAKYLPDIIAGKKIAAVAMTEADAGSDLASMRTTARRKRALPTGDVYVLNGSKMYITNGVHGDIYCVAAKTGAPGRNHQVSMFIVEKGTPGFRVARPLKKHGWLSSDTAELVFEECRIPAAQSAGRRKQGLLCLDEKPAKRAHRARRTINGRSRTRHRNHPRLGHAAQSLRRHAVGQADHPPSPRPAQRPRRSGEAPSSSTPPGATRRARASPRKCR